jgi:hypothetical protein
MTKELYDYKQTSIWTIKAALAEGKTEWTQQMNIQVELLDENGIQVDSAWIMAFARDWSEAASLRDSDYPNKVEKIQIPIWPKSMRQSFIRERIADHKAAREGNARDCTDEERWLRDRKWAVMKKGRKSAVKLHDNEKDAYQHLESLDTKHYIEFRKGTYLFCERYCPAKDFCDQYQEEIK